METQVIAPESDKKESVDIYSSSNKNYITAVDIDDSANSIEEIISERVSKQVKRRLKEIVKELREKRSSEENQETVSEEEIKIIKEQLIKSDEIKKFRENVAEQVKVQKTNFVDIRKTLQDLNDINEFSARIEKLGIQKIDKFITYESMIKLTLKLNNEFSEICSERQNNIVSFAKNLSYDKLSEIPYNRVNSKNVFDVKKILETLDELYKITKDYDDIELYEKFDMKSNIDFSNNLGMVFLKKFAENDNFSNPINDSVNSENSIIKNNIVTNRMFGVLLSDEYISNNRVTCYDNMFTTTFTNDKTYVSRTLGELLLMITDKRLKDIPKENRKQIYMTYNGIRPSSDEYVFWNGLQIYDIDLKKWDGDIDFLKKKMFEKLVDFHWFLWICKSSSGKGIHVYTKVSPAHHIYNNVKNNEYISKYWYAISYISKLNIIYSVLDTLNKEPNNGITFEDKFENEFVDNTVGRITSGIRLSYDEFPLVNNNFLDLHPSVFLHQTLDGKDSRQSSLKLYTRRDEEINGQLVKTGQNYFNTKFLKYIDEELIVSDLKKVKKETSENSIDLSKFINIGGDVTEITPLERYKINYVSRYNVCNTLASLFGKDGLEIAHVILDSKKCGNVKEINAFYTCALSNKKEPTKLGLEILKQCGIIKTVDDKVMEVMDDTFKSQLKTVIEKTINNKLDKPDFELGDNEFISDYRDQLLKKVTGEKINIILSPPGTGKCLAKNTLVLMYDGSLKKVQDIVSGDKLMGWDSRPRNVLSTTMGREEMFDLVDEEGNILFTCNRSHILTLVDSGKFVEKTVDDIVKNGNTLPMTFVKFIDFKKKLIPASPYDMGKKLIKESVSSFIQSVDNFIINDFETRFAFLAGIIDSFFSLRENYYQLVLQKEIVDKIIFLCRTLGIKVSWKLNGKNKILKLSGSRILRIPVKRNLNKIEGFSRVKLKNSVDDYTIKFKLVSKGTDFYYGFCIDDDKRFVLGNLLITHNTEFIKSLARSGKRIMLVLPYISVIKNKVETDSGITDYFDCYYGTKDLKQMEYGRNVVTTFDKFSRCNTEKVSRMFDYLFIDEGHLLYTSSYRIEATSNVMKRLKELYYISSNDMFAAKICMMTATMTGECFFHQANGNFIKFHKKSHTKNMEFLICDDTLDAITRLSSRVVEFLKSGYRIMIPTNKGDMYSEKIIGMVNYLLGREVKYGYYKRSNNDQEICRLINVENTVGDYEIIFCTNYLSVGIDINDPVNFASIYLGNFSGYEIEQFNARIRKTGIDSVYCIVTSNNDGTINETLLEEPSLVLRVTDEDKLRFIDDKAIAEVKQEFVASYDPVLKKITTPGFSMLNGKIQFNIDEYELLMFENKYNECQQHPVKVARELAKYGYNIKVSTEFEGLPKSEQENLRKLGIEAAREEKIRKHDLLVGTYLDLVRNNNFINENGLEYNNVVDWIGKHPDDVIEDRNLETYVRVEFDVFASPQKCYVKSKEALDKMYRQARYMLKRYSIKRATDIINNYVDESGILKIKNFQRAINLMKLIDSSDCGELAEPLSRMLEKMYTFVDVFEKSNSFRISYETYNATLDHWTNEYTDMLGIKLNSQHAFDKVRDSLSEMLLDVAKKDTSKAGVRFSYNKLESFDSVNVLNRRSIDQLVENMFELTSTLDRQNKKIKEKHVVLETQDF